MEKFQTGLQKIFLKKCETGKSASEIISEKGLSQISDQGELEKLVDEVLLAILIM